MKIRELVADLLGVLPQDVDQFAEEFGDPRCLDREVRLAMQPSWPFEYSISKVVVSHSDDDIDGMIEAMKDPAMSDNDRAEVAAELDQVRNEPPVVYIAEGRQLGYLPGNVMPW